MTSVVKRPDRRGFRGRGSGRARGIMVPPVHRGSSSHVGGLTPWGVSSGLPSKGCPVGHLEKDTGIGASFQCDPIAWFLLKLLATPSAFLLGKPGLGKSSLIRRWIEWYVGIDVIPLIPGDIKPDYVQLIRALGGQVLSLGRGVGALNILDMGDVPSQVARIREMAAKLKDTDKNRSADLVAAAVNLQDNAKSRRQTAVESLLTIQRGKSPEDNETSLVSAALTILDRRWASSRKRNLPLLSDVLALIQDPPKELRDIALDRGDDAEYHRTTKALQNTLIALTMPGGLGDVFNKQTTIRMRRDTPVVVDLSSIDDSDEKLRSAALIAGWALAFNQVSVSNALADAKLEPQRTYVIIMDELWMALRQGVGMVDKVDALSRLDRNKGVGVIKCSHTMKDLEALTSKEDRAKAKGLVERSGMQILFGLPMSEMSLLQGAVALSGVEQAKLAANSTPPDWNPDGTEAPPGLGVALCKVGGSPGLLFRVDLVEAERELHNTNHRWVKP